MRGTKSHRRPYPPYPPPPTHALCRVSPNRFSEEAELDDAVHTALLTMREGFEGEMTEKNIEVLHTSSTADVCSSIIYRVEVEVYIHVGVCGTEAAAYVEKRHLWLHLMVMVNVSFLRLYLRRTCTEGVTTDDERTELIGCNTLANAHPAVWMEREHATLLAQLDRATASYWCVLQLLPHRPCPS